MKIRPATDIKHSRWIGLRRNGLMRARTRAGFLKSWSGRVGLGLVVAVVLVALLGPLVAPDSPTEIVGIPVGQPTGSDPLGTDFLGRDALSRVLHGGRTVLGLSLAATAVAYLIGLPAGLTAGYSRARADSVIMRGVDVILAFPPLLFLLVVATAFPNNVVVLVLAVGVVLVPGLSRLVRAAVQDVSQLGYVEAAIARGESTLQILRREILPNILGVLLADVGLRFGSAVLLMAAASFLGLGLQPPTSDWALMVAENRTGLTLQPWVVVVPALLIALLVIGANLAADAIARSLGVSRDDARADGDDR